jgi:DNA-binding response OmpR family regulator
MRKQRKKVLVIEDEREMLKLLKKRLEANHFQCITAENPVDGLKRAVKMKPDLILLDLMLPRMSGFGFLRLIKGNPNVAGIPVVVLTALGDEEIAREAMELGAVAYLTKACEPQTLIDTVKEYA